MFGVPIPERPEIPSQAGHVWSWFWWLHCRRTPSLGSGLSPLTPDGVLAAYRLMSREIDPVEIDMLFQMDDSARRQWARKDREQREHDEAVARETRKK